MKSRPQVGFWLETESHVACELAALLGFELVILDMEHGSISSCSADRLVLLSKLLGLTVFVRLVAADRSPIQQALDWGADGVIIPQIENAEHARMICNYAKYPPLGTRGVGNNRPGEYGTRGPEFYDAENRLKYCFPMVETPGALMEVNDIAALATVDGLFLGPTDLSMRRGRGPNQWTAADLADAERVIQSAQEADKYWAMPAADGRKFEFACQHNALFVTVTDDVTALKWGLDKGLSVAGL